VGRGGGKELSVETHEDDTLVKEGNKKGLENVWGIPKWPEHNGGNKKKRLIFT